MEVKVKEFNIPTKSEYLDPIRGLIRGFVQDNSDFDNIMLMRLILSIDEAVSNIMEHSHKWDENLTIRLKTEIDDEKIVFSIYDQGPHDFHPDQRDNVILKDHIAQRKKRGLGWFIIKTIMDTITYEHLPERGNLLTMIKKKKGHKAS